MGSTPGGLGGGSPQYYEPQRGRAQLNNSEPPAGPSGELPTHARNNMLATPWGLGRSPSITQAGVWGQGPQYNKKLETIAPTPLSLGLGRSPIEQGVWGLQAPNIKNLLNSAGPSTSSTHSPAGPSGRTICAERLLLALNHRGREHAQSTPQGTYLRIAPEGPSTCYFLGKIYPLAEWIGVGCIEE